MDVCHVLLGRLWLYGRRVIHDGYQNTYSFVKDGKKITFTPLDPRQMPKHKPSKPTETSKKLLTLMESKLKATQHKFRSFKVWILQIHSDPNATPTVPPQAK